MKLKLILNPKCGITVIKCKKAMNKSQSDGIKFYR